MLEISGNVSVSMYDGDKFTLLEDFIQEQSQESPPQQKQQGDSLATQLQGLWTEQSNWAPGDGSTSKACATRPQSSRGPSYTYMRRVRELEVEEATKSAVTPPLAQWNSVKPTVSARSAQATISKLQPPWIPDFVGQIVDLGIIDDRMKEESHITVIRGPGGTGKSACHEPTVVPKYSTPSTRIGWTV
ncbi:uncharacterized protein Z519_01868 [Cladophialophora bantiana CBS 173.52]|uniref:Uncharacterized protein n=1 Tax=Cladophialophora bantiana (strain ATCC 10958 / CBS 173.52 / CDC B-1940 / NIH 8579) TaxID=1442370 RepID=A0A0D2INB3_CLAB1|nr:uncharacterized protein Z519_01868 [Cladophialophora bantiana CBS 173.52]KIW98284.1 hypothetical protein Z519_01868 [Cladophialophora bantiana CBS 173.52]